MIEAQSPVSRHSITAAAARISPYVRRTPLLHCATGELCDVAVTLKLELLQHAGSFKPRGAFNRMLSTPLPASGVIAASGGNHGAAVAYAARALGVAAEIFVPELTPQAKRDRILSFGARLTVGGAAYNDALAASRLRAEQTGAVEIHAYDHADVLSGQGTTALEFEEDAAALSPNVTPGLTHVLVATGGGGLIGGMAAWYAGRTEVISVEPEGCPTLHAAFAAGHPTPVSVASLAADSLGARQVGALMFPIAQAFISQTVVVSDAAITAAQRLIWDRLRLISEPGGATALAALLSGAWTPPAGARIGVLLCGSNTDPGSLR